MDAEAAFTPCHAPGMCDMSPVVPPRNSWHRTIAKPFLFFCCSPMSRVLSFPGDDVQVLLARFLRNTLGHASLCTRVGGPSVSCSRQCWLSHGGPSLRTTSALRTLSLAGCFLHDRGALLLADVLKENTHLSLLDLRLNLICDEGVHALGDALRVNQGLKELNLEGNFLSNVSVSDLVPAVAASQLHTIYLSDLRGAFEPVGLVHSRLGFIGSNQSSIFDTLPEVVGGLRDDFTLCCRPSGIRKPPVDSVLIARVGSGDLQERQNGHSRSSNLQGLQFAFLPPLLPTFTPFYIPYYTLFTSFFLFFLLFFHLFSLFTLLLSLSLFSLSLSLLSLPLSPSLALSLSHSLTLSHSHSHTLSHSLFWSARVELGVQGPSSVEDSASGCPEDTRFQTGGEDLGSFRPSR